MSTNSKLLRNLETNKYALQMGNSSDKTVSQLVSLITGFKSTLRPAIRTTRAKGSLDYFAHYTSPHFSLFIFVLILISGSKQKLKLHLQHESSTQIIKNITKLQKAKTLEEQNE
jgi:hypothetical protein